MSAGRCLHTADPRLAFRDAWRLHRHYVGDFRTVSTESIVTGDEEEMAGFIDRALMANADSIHESIERAAANYGLMVASDCYSHAEFCQQDGEIVCHLASWSIAFGRN